MTQGKAVRTNNPRTFNGEIAARARRNGFDLNKPLNTRDGDDVSIFAIDQGHPYPLVGEVYDFNVGIAWLARWNEAGQYQGTLSATARHSLERNVGERDEDGFVNGWPRPSLGMKSTAQAMFRGMFRGMFLHGRAPVAGMTEYAQPRLINDPADIRDVRSGPASAPVQPEVTPDVLGKRFAAMLAVATVEALREGFASPEEINVTSFQAIRLYATKRLTISAEVEVLDYDVIARTVDALVQMPDASAHIDRIVLPLHAERVGNKVPYAHAGDLTPSMVAREVIARAVKTSRPGGLDYPGVNTL